MAKNQDNLRVLSDLTGVDKEKISSIWEQVKANQARLDTCNLHDFEQIESRFGSKWRCKKCQGEADASAVLWYQKGLNHSNQN